MYAVADTDATTCTFLISTSSSAPTGATYYRKIGYFYNNSDGDITNVGNIKGGDAGNIVSVTGSTDITTNVSGVSIDIYGTGIPRICKIDFASGSVDEIVVKDTIITVLVSR